MVTVSTHYDIKAQQAMDGWKLTVKEMATVLTHPDTATNINAHLMSREDAFYHLFDNGGPGRIPKAVLAAELAPGHRTRRFELRGVGLSGSVPNL